MIVGGQDRLDEEVDRMALEVRRDVADPQPPLGRAIVARAARLAAVSGSAWRWPQARCSANNVASVVGRMIVQRVKQVAVQFGFVWVRRDGLAMMRDRLVEPADGLQGTGQIAVGIGAGGIQFDGAAAADDGFVVAPSFGPNGAEIVVRDDVFGIEPDRLLRLGDRILPATLSMKGRRHAQMRRDARRIDEQRRAKMFEGFVNAPAIEQQHSQAVSRLDGGGIAGHGLAK